MSRFSTQFNSRTNHKNSKGRRRLSAVLLAVLLIAFAIVVSGVLAQKDVNPPASESGRVREKYPRRPTGTASATNTGHITGTVTAEDGGAPLVGIAVCANLNDFGIITTINCVTSDTSGNYDIDSLPVDNYYVEYSHPVASYKTEWYNNANSIWEADTISVDDGATVSGIDAALSLPDHIMGTITSDNGGAPLAGIEACAWIIDDYFYDFAKVRCALTDDNGNFAISIFEVRNYYVNFSDTNGDHLSEWYDNVQSRWDATGFPVGNGASVSGIDASLAEADHITGTVTADADGALLQDIQVSAYYYNGSWWNQVQYAISDANGSYDIGGLADGVYRLGFLDRNDVYLDEYYNNAPDLSSADNVTVTVGSTTSGVNIALTEGGHITGTVTSVANGDPLVGIEVCPYYFSEYDYWEVGICTNTDANGDYDIRGLVSDTYRIGFYDSNEQYIAEYFDNVSQIDSASDISILAGNTISGIDAALKSNGGITGTVTDETSGLPLENISACAFADSVYGWSPINCNSTDTNGYYDIVGLNAGTYRVGFSVNAGRQYIDEYYDDAPDLDSASDIAVELGVATAGIDAALAEFGHITGTVSEEVNGLPLKDITVCALTFSGISWKVDTCDITNPGGEFDISGLDTDIYRIKFSDPSNGIYRTEYYDDAIDADSAVDVPVSIGTTTAGISAALASLPPPDNDDFDNATLVNTFPYNISQQTSLATTAVDDPVLPCGQGTQGYGSVWFAITPAEDILLTADTNSSDYNTILAIWTGSRGDLTNLACNDDSYGSQQSHIGNVLVEGGVTYYIEIAGYSASLGSLRLNIELTEATAVPHDDIDQASMIPYTPFSSISEVQMATTAADDPVLPCLPGNQGYSSVWYTFTPISDGFLSADTEGSTYATVLALWSGSRGNLTEEACSSGSAFSGPELVDVPLTGGEIYYIEVTSLQTGSGNLSLQLNTSWTLSSPLTGCVQFTGGDASVAVPDTVYSPGSFALEPGDELALYTPDGTICAGFGRWTGNSIAINAWGDDSQTAERDGFAPGEAFRWAIWDASRSILHDPVTATYGTGDGQFVENSIHIISSFDPSLKEIFTITLDAGWNMISTYGETDDPAISSILADIASDVVVVKNGDGQVYWPAMGVDQIGDWNVGQGYQVYMDQPGTLHMSIVALDPTETPLPLDAGWNLISYLNYEGLPPESALGSINSELVIAKDGEGRVYWPAYGIDQLDDLQAGAGYHVFLSSPATLTYPRN